MDVARLTAATKRKAHDLGFDWARIVPVDSPPHADFYERWATPDYVGEMQYLARNRERRRAPRLLSDETTLRSLIVLAVDYHQFALPEEVRADPSRGLIAAYAWGDDYHELIKPRLFQLDAFIAAQTGRTTRGKCLVDTGPVLERDWAMQAGLGFTGKNCCTIRPGTGSWLFLATVMVPETLAYDAPPTHQESARNFSVAHKPARNGLDPSAEFLDRFQGPVWSAAEVFAGMPAAVDAGTWTLDVGDESRQGTCGRCTRCLTACPTDAFVGPFHLNPQRCIAYWTIEAQTPIPTALRPLFGNRIFGCDICQEVCPWNPRQAARAPRLPGLEAQDGRVAPPLLQGFAAATPYWLDQDAFNSHFRRSPIKRAKRQGMLRNVCVALGNWADPVTVPALATALQDAHPLPRGHAAWALGQVWARHAHAPARDALEKALNQESVSWVRHEIVAARDRRPSPVER